jgi:hypothetical protein
MMAQLVHFPLEDAYLCADLQCRSVGNSANWCPACAGTTLQSLAKILNRQTAQQETENKTDSGVAVEEICQHQS